MKYKKIFITFATALAFVTTLLFFVSGASGNFISPKYKSLEMIVHSESFLGKQYGKVVAASCGVNIFHAHDRACTTTALCNNVTQTVSGTKDSCAGACNPTCPPCANKALNLDTCICASNQVLINGICEGPCTNGATNPTACDICPGGQFMQNNKCTCDNGANDPANGCFTCPKKLQMIGGFCRTPCSVTNSCGQTKVGYLENKVCNAVKDGENPDDSCIVNFDISTPTVNPNGSVEFSWKLGDLPTNVSSRCGFVDLTTPTPRPIPGLQNLSPQTDRIRINNIQTTTRFCLVCQFYNLTNNNNLGEAALHQWVRVIRVGEN